jgi:preprotein translocase subunit SecD
MFGQSTAGAIYSFGYTLLIGVILNFVMGVTASRLMLKSISKFKPFQKLSLYGGAK